MKPQEAVNFNYDTLVVKYTAYEELEKKLKIAVEGYNNILKPKQAIGSMSEDINRIDNICNEVLQQIREK